jgi:hypothetical protein
LGVDTTRRVETPGAGAAGGDVLDASLAALSKSLGRRGFFTTEWWTTMIGGALSAALALIHIKASSATHVVAVVSPALLAALYAITRTMHKSALASALSDFFPQAGGDGAAGGGAVSGGAGAGVAGGAGAGVGGGAGAAAVDEASAGVATPVEAEAGAQVPTETAVTQTDPDFVFEGIPPIEEVDG